MIADNSQPMRPSTPHYDVIIVGAGLSGVGMACHLKRNCFSKSFTILEARESIGGTWDLFRYPGVRADSDMYTLSYNFKPWRGKREIADGDEILSYIKEAAAEHKITNHIRYGHALKKATWCSDESRWTLEATVNGITQKLTCNMLLMCAGYYNYSAGHTPTFQGQEDFQGSIIHPQQWPADIDCKDKRIIVVGSGATSVSLVPVIAEEANHVTMLQRSPTYMMTRPETTKWAGIFRRFLPVGISHRIGRWWNLRLSQVFYQLSREKPDKIRKFLLDGVRNELGEDYDIDKHFSPSYAPWDQRVCLVRNNDLFDAINSGSVSVVTGHIESFTASGVRLFSGEELPADIIVTATGLDLKVMGGTELIVDGSPVNPAETFTYKGMMNSDVPNLISTFGYVTASWTLRSDLIGEFTCRLINYMDNKRLRMCTPRLRESDRGMSVRPFIDSFTSNYIQRGSRLMPMQGDHEPWIYTQDYQQDQQRMLNAPLDDGALVFE